MTEPPAAPRPDPTADPPPFSTPQSPPYPADGNEHPTYLPGIASVQQPPPAYPPITAVPAYLQETARGSRGLAIGVGVGLVVAVALGGLIGVGTFLILHNGNNSASGPKPAPVPSEAPSPRSSIPGLPGGSPHTVVYEVTGDGDATVAYLGYRDFLDMHSERVDLPWRKEITTDTGLLPATLTAYGFSDSQLSCRISVDGTEVDSDTDDGSVVCFGEPIR
jgi:Mycobacterium membrane protein